LELNKSFLIKNSENGKYMLAASGTVNACLGISTPEYRFPGDPERFIELVVSGATEISRLLGYHH
jgi:DNA-binding IclR family transcriptional regulator